MIFNGKMNTENRPDPESRLTHFQGQLFWVLLAIVVLALQLFILWPFLRGKFPETTLNWIYFISRLFVFLGLGYVFGVHLGLKRVRVFASIMFVGFVDQVVMKWIFTRQDMALHPEAWKDIPFAGSPFNLLFGLTQGFLYFLPILMILAFFGMEFGKFLRKTRP